MTILGSAAWKTAEPFYDGLSLENDGDATVEKYGVKAHNIQTRFPNYESFWKKHVCPATIRPNGITFTAKVDDTVSLIAQRSYTVLAYVIESLEYLNLVTNGDVGERNRHAYIALMYSGNALQVFTELQFALCGPSNKVLGKRTLADHLGESLEPFPDWSANWNPRREAIVSYRNYLTHQGWFYSVKKAGQETLVLKSEHVSRDAFTWTDAERDYDADSTRWTTLSNTCSQIIGDTIGWLDDAYGALRRVADPLLTQAEYQELWGWESGKAIPPLVRLRSASSGQKTVVTRQSSLGGSVKLTGSTASKVDDSPLIVEQDRPSGSGMQ